jgi:acyl dehydratase
MPAIPLAEVPGWVGRDLGSTDWILVDQGRIDQFARATGDHQWIHVDPERAAAGPYGATIAHGYLTLSLANLFLPQLLSIPDAGRGVNYGVDRARFPAVVRVGSRVRGRGSVAAAEPSGSGVHVVVRVTIEIEGSDRPACVVDTISRFYPS